MYVMEWWSAIDVIDVLIDRIPNGNTVNVDASRGIPYMDLNA